MEEKEQQQWYQKSADAVLDGVAGSRDGLSEEEAERRLAEAGPNELVELHQRRALKILIEQFTATMELILIGASVVSIVLGALRDSVAILAIVVLFAVLGFIQDYRAEKAMAALKKLAVPIVRVRRGGQVKEVSARSLVPGDIVYLEAGNIVPADARLIEVASLKVQESALTGEPEPEDKDCKAIGGETSLADRTNMVFMGTIAVFGRATAVVVETGMRTELGKIASILQTVPPHHTPLQKRLDRMGKMVAVVGFAVSVIVIFAGLLRGDSIVQLLLAGISIAVAVIPEGLPAVVTITLALGSQRMLKRNALIRKLPAVEALGSVTVICSDKTGTLTQNRMTVVSLAAGGQTTDFNVREGKLTGPTEHLTEQYRLILAAGGLCNDAKLSDGGQGPSLIGDPTEAALVEAADKVGLFRQLQQDLPRVAEIPFDSDRKRMTTVHKAKSVGGLPHFGFLSECRYISFTKGASDVLLGISDRVLIGDNIIPLTEEMRRDILTANEKLASKGIRVIGAALSCMQDFNEPTDAAILEQGLVFIGAAGLTDPPRQEARQAVLECKEAGIRPIMITGDHPLTAAFIASELGILDGGRVATGIDLEKMSLEEFEKVVEDISVYARVSPEHKLKIVQALQDKGEVVAMTGDGVNDAPALKKADIGLSMGMTGTDVSKDASDIVLLDDNFASIVNAVEEGRIIYDNIKKFVKFSVGGNLGKVIVMLAGPFVFESLPMVPLQVLWLNLLTDGLLGLGLGLEKGERSIMRRPPIKPTEGVFAAGGALGVTLTGIIIGVVTLTLGAMYFLNGNDKWQTMIFASIAMGQVWQAMSIRSSTDPVYRIGLFSNPTLISMAVLTLGLQAMAIYLPFLRSFLKTVPLGISDILLCLGAGVSILVLLEVGKLVMARRRSATKVALA